MAMIETRHVNVDRRHVELMRDLSQVIFDFQQEHPDIDSVEVIAMLGAVAGACISSNPDPAERDRVQKSVVSSMDAAIRDFLKERERRSRH
jgi:hypothetical protein